MLDELMEAWAEGLNGNRIPHGWRTVKELTDRNFTDSFDKALRDATRARELETLNPVKVGMLFRKHANRVRNGMRIASELDGHNKVMRWQLLGRHEFMAARAAGGEQTTAADAALPAPQERRPGRKATRRPEPKPPERK
jgi:hypothetical protein